MDLVLPDGQCVCTVYTAYCLMVEQEHHLLHQHLDTIVIVRHHASEKSQTDCLDTVLE